MILAVTLNPAHDVTYELPALTPGEVHRVQRVHRRPGGKAVNVAAVAQQVGADAVVTGLASPDFAAAVAGLGLPERLVPLLASVRSTLAVVTAAGTTSLWEPGSAPADPAAAALSVLERVAGLLPFTGCLVVSGSLVPGLPVSLPADLARAAVAAGVPVIVDTSGPALEVASAVRGVVLMPNADELGELVGAVGVTASAHDVAAAGRQLLARGASAVLATRGSDGIVATSPDGSWLVSPPHVAVGNTTGAGDAAAAAVAIALSRGASLPDAACDAVALAATAVAAPVAGQIDPRTYAELRASVTARPLTEGPP